LELKGSILELEVHMSATLTRTRGPALLAAALFLAFLAAVSPAFSASRSVIVVKTAKNAKLGKTILVGLNGHTLYHLSVERNGKFICTDKTCLSLWHPLVVRKGVKPAGTSRLGTVKRPDGRRQVTYRGGPLYFFVQDKKRGDVKGEGFKDVGTWHAASPQASSSSSPPPSSGGSPTTPYPYRG
jgi:predicted lipoprotein with Yx(FWY)xxD motif